MWRTLFTIVRGAVRHYGWHIEDFDFFVLSSQLGVSRQDGSLPSLPTNVEIRTQMTSDSADMGETRSQVMPVPNDGVLFLDIFVPFGVSELTFEAIAVGSSRIGNLEPYESTIASKTRMTVLRRQIHASYILQVFPCY